MEAVGDAQGPEALTDLFTNYVRFGAFSRTRDPRDWLGLRPAPLEELSVFLHEITHHWCFLTPVNFAVANLMARARMSVLDHLSGEAISYSPFPDVAGAQTVIRLLRPINEGLALFAEFDATSRMESRVQSQVVDGALAAYSTLSDWDIPEGISEQLAATLISAKMFRQLRTSKAILEKKASLLLRPLDATVDPYLLGYLSVKSLWRTASRAVPRLATETDLFLMYLRSYIFGDAGLVCALLEPCETSAEMAERVILYLSGRIDRFDEITPEDVQEFEASVESPSGVTGANVLSVTPGIRVSSDTLKRAQALLDEQTEYWRSAQKNKKRSAWLSRWTTEVFNQRHYATLVSANVTLEVATEGQEVIVKYADDDILRGGAECVLSDVCTSGPAQLDIIFNMAEFSRAAVLSRDGESLVCIPLWTPESADEIREDVAQWHRSQASLVQHEAELRVVDDFLMQSKSPVADPIRKAQETVLPFWIDVAFRYARDYESIDSCAEMMARRGFRGLTGKSSLVRQIALMGLTLSLNVDKTNLRQVFDSYKWDLTKVLEDIAKLYDEYGFPPQLFVTEEQVFSSI